MKQRATKPSADLLQAEHGEGIAMRAGDDRLDVAGGGLTSRASAPRPRGFFIADVLPAIGMLLCAPCNHSCGTFQISLAYCRIVRSDENQPMRAMLRIALAYQSGLSRQSASTSRWAAA